MSNIAGFLNINKPGGMTSHDVVAQVRRLLKRGTGSKKVGHAGTLDPMATGVLVLCLGQATRLSEYAMQSTKQYRAQVRLGINTDTYDAEGEVLSKQDVSHIQRVDVENELPPFIGDIQQVPPVYSAIKQDGKKLYELARAGKKVQRKARAVRIDAIKLIEWTPPSFTIDIICGSGTYIRSLAYDIGAALDVGAHLSGLQRTRSGAFCIQNSVALETMLNSAGWQQYVIPPAAALRDWQAIELNAGQAADIRHGRRIENETTLSDDFVMAYLPDGHLLAVLENQGKQWKPHKVFLPDT